MGTARTESRSRSLYEKGGWHMVYTDGSEVMIDGVILPGLFKSLEVTTAAEIEEQEVEGSAAQPKQATGYEDGKINLELILMDEEGMLKEDKLLVIQNFFRQQGQDIPAVHTIINPHTALRNITQVVLKNMVTKETNANAQLAVTLEFWEYIPMTISVTAAKATGKAVEGQASQGSSNLKSNYTKYLESRGAAPKLADKTEKSPVKGAKTGIRRAAK